MKKNKIFIFFFFYGIVTDSEFFRTFAVDFFSIVCMKNTPNGSLSVALILLMLISAAFPFASCQSEPVPESPVMDEASFTDFLEDAYLLESFYSLETHFLFDTLAPEMIASYDTLLARHGITHAVVDTTIQWYTHHSDIYLRVLDSVMARMDRANQAVIEARKKAVEEAMKADSIN